MKEAWSYDSVSEKADATVLAIVADAEGICGEIRMWYESEAAGVFRLWQAIVGDAALEDDVARLEALCEKLRAPTDEDPTPQLGFSLRRVV